MKIKNRREAIGVNPLTGLPGNKEITKQLEKIIGDADKLTVYIDITDFKPYNEVYGFAAGDNVILSVAELLKKGCIEVCGKNYFIGHIGGDDYLLIMDEKFTENFFKWMDKEFLLIRNSFYRQPDISRQFIVGWDRKGERTRFPLIGICGVAFSSYRQGFNTVEQISEYATHLKEASKTRRRKDNIFITPEDLDILPVPLENFILDENIPLFKKRTVIEAMGESGMIHYGRILAQLLEKPISGLLKKSIIFSLGRLRYVQAEEILLRFTGNNNPHLRTRAVEAIGHIGGAKHLQRIGEMVSDPNPYVAVMAVKSLADIGHPGGLKFIREIPAGSSRWLKIEAAITRCRLGDKQVLSELEKLIKDLNPIFRKRAARALELIPSKECAMMLYRAIEIEKIDHARNSLIISLGRIARSLSSYDIQEISALIWKTYKDAPSNVRPYLLPSLGKCRFEGVKKILEDKINSSSSFERCLAIEGMVNYNDPEHVYLIRKGLKDITAQVRVKSAQALGEIKDTEGMEFLRKSLKDSDDMVRRRASESVLKMTSQENAKFKMQNEK